MKYINGNKDKKACVFCTAANMADTYENLIVKRGENAFIILNRFPYNNAHLLVVPYIHCAELTELPSGTLYEIMDLGILGMKALKALYAPQGFNLGFNIGRVAGAGIAEHLHMHVIPRWTGDTNFISTIGETRVLAEELTETFNRISEYLR